jgi:tocopherol cyclase
MQGKLDLELRQIKGDKRLVILKAHSHLCGLEIGGGSWDDSWQSS